MVCIFRMVLRIFRNIPLINSCNFCFSKKNTIFANYRYNVDSLELIISCIISLV